MAVSTWLRKRKHPGDTIRTGNASGDDDDVGILEGGLGAIVGGQVASGFLSR